MGLIGLNPDGGVSVGGVSARELAKVRELETMASIYDPESGDKLALTRDADGRLEMDYNGRRRVLSADDRRDLVSCHVPASASLTWLAREILLQLQRRRVGVPLWPYY